jgi:hypothetical protein
VPPIFRRRGAISATSHEAFGVRFSVQCTDPALRPLALDALPPGSALVPGADGDAALEEGRFAISVTGPDRHTVTLDGGDLVTNATREVALGLFDAQVRLFVAARSPDLVFVHAGVVAWHERAIAIPGQSFTGKTTLVAALVRAGATYVSDEYAPLDAGGRVHPFPRRLTIRGEVGGDELEQSPDQLGEVVDAGARLELAAIVVTRYVPGATFAPGETTAGQGALALLANTVPASERPRQSLAAVATAARGSIVLEGERGDAEPAAATILAITGERWG